MTETVETTNNGSYNVATQTFTTDVVPAGAPTYEQLQRLLVIAKADLEAAESRYEQAQKDWTKLNEFLNEYAEENDMCSQYEDRLNTWNTDFTRFKLEGRYQDYSVCTKVTVTYYVNVNVSAKNTSDAIDEADGIDSSTIMEAIADGCGFDGYDEIEWDAREAEPII